MNERINAKTAELDQWTEWVQHQIASKFESSDPAHSTALKLLSERVEREVSRWQAQVEWMEQWCVEEKQRRMNLKERGEEEVDLLRAKVQGMQVRERKWNEGVHSVMMQCRDVKVDAEKVKGVLASLPSMVSVRVMTTTLVAVALYWYQQGQDFEKQLRLLQEQQLLHQTEFQQNQ
jgi:hypothetical protein